MNNCMDDSMINEILSCCDVKRIPEIEKIVKKYPNKCYEYTVNKFEFLPKEIYNDFDADKEPIDAFLKVTMDVDGAKGFSTNYTPKKVIELYKKAWRTDIETKKVELVRKSKYEHYKLEWRKDNWGDVSGDVLISFPKNKLYQEIINSKVECVYLKLLARLSYTYGNFMPVPKKGAGRSSVNSLHSYQSSFYKKYKWERIDKFLYDVLFNKESYYKENYAKFGDYFENCFIERNFLQCYMLDGKVIDLVSGGQVNNVTDFRNFDTDTDIQSYIINACARIIFRGNILKKEIEKCE